MCSLVGLVQKLAWQRLERQNRTSKTCRILSYKRPSFPWREKRDVQKTWPSVRGLLRDASGASDTMSKNAPACLQKAVIAATFRAETFVPTPYTVHCTMYSYVHTVQSSYNVPRLQRIHCYNVRFLRSRFYVMEHSQSGYNVLSLQRSFFRFPGSTL